MSEKNDELFNNIVSDKNKRDSCDRYPVRFLFFSLSNNLIKYILDLAQRLSINIKKISDYFSENKWATWEFLFSKIEEDIAKSSTDIIFLGLSEFLRFESINSLESIFINLIGIENTYNNKINKRRVYFVMDSFEKLFSAFALDKNHHHRNIFYDPIIHGNSTGIISEKKNPELVISIVISGKQNVIKTVREYLDLSANSDSIDFDKKIYCVSNTIYNLSKKNTEFLEDSLFPYFVIDNKLLILKNKIIGLIVSEQLSEEFVDYLSANIDMDDIPVTFDSFIKEKLELEDISIETLLYKYFSIKDENEKKLIKLAFKLLGENDKGFAYLNHLFSNYKIDTKNEFITQLYLCNDLFVENVGFDERKTIINLIAKKDEKIIAPEALIELYNTALTKVIKNNVYFDSSFNASIKDVNKVLLTKGISEEKIKEIYIQYKKSFIEKFLTSKSIIERRIIILLASNFVFSNSELEKYYPELYGYLLYKSEFKKNYAILDDYFIEYKKSKIANSPTEKLKKYYNNLTSESFLNFYNSNDFDNVNNIVNANNIFVFDGVGAEYLSLITYLLEKKYEKKLKVVDYKKALIPTVTETNKQLINTLKPEPYWKQEFDSEIIHGEFYSVERNVEKAITLIDKMINQIIEESNGQSFIIIADHGSTVSHKIFGTTKKYDFFPEAEHDGRCCHIFKKENIKCSNDYVQYTDRTGKNWIISITPTSLNNTAKYEAHGGGTIEEIFVPYIYYSTSYEEEKYDINIIKKQVSGIDKSLKFIVSPYVDAEQITIIEETGAISKPFISDGVYICNLSVGKTQKVVIRINNTDENVMVTNSSGINSNKGGFF